MAKEHEGKKKKRKRMTLEGFAASVELPEGHQLIIGELPSGTVVEVATWQGVGRPDDTTNRFLLTADGPGLQTRRREEITPPEGTKPNVQPVVESKPAPKVEVPNTKSADDAFLGVTSLEKPSIPRTIPQSAWKQRGRAAFTVVAALSIVIVLLNIVGLSFTVPTLGSKTVFGNTANSLVIYKRGTSVTDNAPIVVMSTNNGKKEIVLGSATVYSPTQFEISTTKGLQIENSNSVVGQSVVAIPYLGWLLGPLFH
jgi:hypothetical protein